MRKIQKRLRFSGRVQGVGFRASFRAKARAMGLDGWITNLWDGRVEVVVAGLEPEIDAIVGWCRNGGIPFARVSGVETEDEPLSVESGFNVR